MSANKRRVPNDPPKRKIQEGKTKPPKKDKKTPKSIK